MRLHMMLLAGLVLTSGMAAVGCTSTTTARLGLAELETVESVDLDKLTGTWYEIASFPTRTHRDCVATKVTFSTREDAMIGIRNQARKGGFDGPETTREGSGRTIHGSGNAKIEIQYMWPLWEDFWFIDLDDGYTYAAVGVPSRDYLWILSRDREMSKGVYDGILERLAAKGYQVERLNRTSQPEAAK